MKKNILLFIILSIMMLIFYLNIRKIHDLNQIDFYEVNIDIEQNENNFKGVRNVQELVDALSNEAINIIELKDDIDLGYNIIKDIVGESTFIQCHNEPLIHPILKKTGVSKFKIKNREDLIIFSKSGCRLLHTNIVIENSKNIKIDNIKMEELWEWDEEGLAEYDRNDWDYITIKNSENIQIQHCEFSKCYDGITDIKNSKNVTIEYCKLNEIDVENDTFFNSQFDELEKNIDKYSMYKYLRQNVDLSVKKIKEISAYQYKGYLIVSTDYSKKNENIIIHDCLYLNAKIRMPKADNSNVYLYKVYMDSSKINDELLNEEKRKIIKEKYPKVASIGSFGVISVNKANVILENCIFDGVKHKYTIWDEKSLKSFGKIIEKQNKEIISNLKMQLENTSGNKIFEN